uniref:Uncharacterized protein n=1 Tax=Kryptolebias marmoratus TaxID=37003 RepID=A0A3Q3GXQ3_KRYMA
MFSTVMEGRINRGRGGSWKRGGRGGNDADGEHRGRGRGGHHRGRGRRDHHRGRGRGDKVEDEDDRMEVFSRRKLESNWDRYEEAERAEEDADTPAQRGTDYHVLLESAGKTPAGSWLGLLSVCCRPSCLCRLSWKYAASETLMNHHVFSSSPCSN